MSVWSMMGWALLSLAQAVSAAGITDTEGESRAARRTPVVDVFEANRDAVVNISSTRIVSVRPGWSTLDDRPFSLFDAPFRRPRQLQATSLGSGFVMHPSGYIVTNAHVVARAAELKASFADGREFEARIVAADTEHDLAVLKIDAPGALPTIHLGHSDDLMVGETVVAIGNPFGFKHTVTSGVISAVGRNLEVDEGTTFRDLIQTDASINPGNSGGPLLNILGELIGINTAIRGDAENMAFAIPVDQLLNQLPEMLNIEHLRRVRLGLRVSGRDAAGVTEVSSGSPADEAGVKPRDIITAVDGAPLRRDIDFYFALLEKGPERPIRIDLLRDGKPKRVELTIREIPKPDGAELARRLFGLHVRELAPEQCRRLGLRPGAGLLVVGVERSSPAAEIGVAPGDVISSLGRYYVSTLDEIGELLQYAKRGDEVRIGGLRLERDELWRIEGTLRAR
ncbi:MAG: trypsin-like peptidase domain-containing protein [Phycisphaerales bacterium]|nr:MAG: trypsin-like peptidase domain-containing protein [Phycisphaerales bacterium]